MTFSTEGPKYAFFHKPSRKIIVSEFFLHLKFYPQLVSGTAAVLLNIHQFIRSS